MLKASHYILVIDDWAMAPRSRGSSVCVCGAWRTLTKHRNRTPGCALMNDECKQKGPLLTGLSQREVGRFLFLLCFTRATCAGQCEKNAAQTQGESSRLRSRRNSGNVQVRCARYKQFVIHVKENLVGVESNFAGRS